MVSKNKLRERLTKRLNSQKLEPLKLVQAKYDSENLVPSIMNFVAAYPAFARKLFDYHGHVPHLGSRLGRGEVLIWYIFDDVKLGGSSSTCDVIVDNKPVLEIKSAKREGERYSNFMLGIDEVPASLKLFYKLLKLFEKNERLGKLMIPQNFANLSKRKLEELKKVNPTPFRKAIDRYLDDLMASPIGEKEYLIFDQATALPVYHGHFKKEQLRVERVSGGLVRFSFLPSLQTD